MAVLVTSASVLQAGTPIYNQRAANGSVIFSDAPMVNGEMVRSSYQTEFGRPVARSSCMGLTAKNLAKRAETYNQIIQSAASTHNIEAKLIKAVAEVESCFDANAVSRVGAQGIMQLMPATAAELGVTDSFNSAQNINGGAKYLAQMLRQFDQNPTLALAAYNAGPGAVRKYRGIPPYPETENYVKKVLSIYSN